MAVDKGIGLGKGFSGLVAAGKSPKVMFFQEVMDQGIPQSHQLLHVLLDPLIILCRKAQLGSHAHRHEVFHL
ncbi:hypothetical protein ACQKEF_12465 [Pseudomonas oryzihabitans]|uniref:hypothetical protein n=1 Tax=Pseudomonas oryzihabitans TaxID=47885 RepID=UPI003CFDBF14